jgi:hypothetical protein
MNKVPRKKGYVPNMYTGRSMMRYGGMERKKAAMGMSKMDEDMMGSMRQQMMAGNSPRYSYNVGGKVSANIYEMESACNKMAGYNRSLPKNR